MAVLYFLEPTKNMCILFTIYMPLNTKAKKNSVFDQGMVSITATVKAVLAANAL